MQVFILDRSSCGCNQVAAKDDYSIFCLFYLSGVVVGCSIGLCCIAMCTATLVLRRQCGKPPRCANNNGPMRDAANGNGFYHERTGCNERHELQCLTQHIDSKVTLVIFPRFDQCFFLIHFIDIS